MKHFTAQFHPDRCRFVDGVRLNQSYPQDLGAMSQKELIDVTHRGLLVEDQDVDPM